MPDTDFSVGLFETISSLLQEQQTGSRQNRRDGERHPFQCVQLIAPFDGLNLPGTEQLRFVQCHDISPRGFSFHSNAKPDAGLVVVGLGKIPFQFFIAEIVHVRPIETAQGYRHLVGCRFLQRVPPSGTNRVDA